MIEQKATLRVGTKSRVTIPQRFFDSINENGGFEKKAYLVLKSSARKRFYQHPARRVSLTEFNPGDFLVISYIPSRGAFFKVEKKDMF